MRAAEPHERVERLHHARARAAESADVPTGDAAEATDAPAFSPLWDDFEAVRCPLMVVRGSLSPVVDDDDIAEGATEIDGAECADVSFPGFFALLDRGAGRG